MSVDLWTMENVANIQRCQYQFPISMKHGEELWVGVGIGEPETSNQQTCL